MNALTTLAGNDDSKSCPNDDHSRVIFRASAGTAYRIAVDGRSGAKGTVLLLIRPADPPANDDFLNAQALSGSLPLNVAGTNVDASKEPSEPDHTQTIGIPSPGGASVWYSWTSNLAGPVVLTTCGSTVRTLVGIYTGTTVSALTAVPVSMDSACPVMWTGRFTASLGQTYRIAIDGDEGAGGSFVFTMFQAPANDNFADAQVLNGALPVEVVASTLGATGETDEPNLVDFAPSSSVWYRWAPAQPGLVSVDTCDSAFDTRLGVYTGGALAALTAVATNNDGCQVGASRVVFAAVAGETYHITVDGRPNPNGDIVLRIENVITPPNDDFANADVLSGVLPINIVATNADATRQPGEPNHAGLTGGGSLWYRWTAPTADVAVVDLCESRLDTVVAVYRGTALGNLALVVANNDSKRCGDEGGGGGYLRFAPTIGETYSIAVDGFAGSRGVVVMALRLAPVNDDFAAAKSLTGPLPISVHDDTYDAAPEASEPQHAGVGAARSVWYSWTPTTSGPVVVESCEPFFRPWVAVYSGETLGSLSALGRYEGEDCGIFGMGRLTLQVTAGTRYRIAVASDDGSPIVLGIRAIDPFNAPANDNFANPQVLTGALPIVASGTNEWASKQPNEPNHGTQGGASVWYRWTATTGAPVAVSTCGSDFAAVVRAYTGDAVGALTPITGAGRSCGESETVTFTPTIGQTYHIAVDGLLAPGVGPDSGTVALTIRHYVPPSNDAFAAARLLAGPLPLTAGGTTVDATIEEGEPDRSPGDNSIWYRWTATVAQLVIIETCESDFPTELSVSTGDTLAALTLIAGNTRTWLCGPDGRSRVTFTTSAGTTYHIAVFSSGLIQSAGTVALTIRPANPPANDDFASAQSLNGPLPITATGTNADASEEAGEPLHDWEQIDPSATVWYRWTALTTGPVMLETCGSAFHALMGVYTGSTLEGLTNVPSAEGSCGSPHAAITRMIPAVAGTTYRIAVAGFLGGTGPFVVRIRNVNPPANDDFAHAQILAGALPITLAASNVDATVEPLEPGHAFSEASASVWYRWTAPSSGPVVVDTCAGELASVTGVYVGSSLPNMINVLSVGGFLSSARVSSCDGGTFAGRTEFKALGGEQYSIAVAGSQRDTGSFTLTIARPPANDDIHHAQVLEDRAADPDHCDHRRGHRRAGGAPDRQRG